MATTYSTFYHNIVEPTRNKFINNQTRVKVENDDDDYDDEDEIFIRNCFMVKNNNQFNNASSRTRRHFLRNSFSVDNIYASKNNNIVENTTSLSTPRQRRTSSILRDIIVESVSENMTEVVEDKITNVNNNNNNNNGGVSYANGGLTKANTVKKHHHHNQDGSTRSGDAGEPKTTRAPKKVYAHRKHHSDFGFVFQLDHHDDDDQDENELDDVIEAENMQTRAASFSKCEDQLDGPRHLRTDSTSSLSPCPGRLRKSSSQMDITDTKMYKDIYADNLRLYGFLVAKKLGISQKSPDQLRRTYQKGRQKAMERRERTNTTAGEAHSERSDESLSSHFNNPIMRERSSTASSTDSNASTTPSSCGGGNNSISPNTTNNLRGNRYTSSLTDISNLTILEKHKKPSTTVIRRRKGSKLPSDPKKRLSAPLMNPITIADLETMTVSMLRKQMASLSVPELSQPSSRNGGEMSDSSHDEITPQSAASHHRKLSDDTSIRHQEARARQEWRLSRIKSFEGVLSQANSLMRDMKTKQTGKAGSDDDGANNESNMVDKHHETINKAFPAETLL